MSVRRPWAVSARLVAIGVAVLWLVTGGSGSASSAQAAEYGQAREAPVVVDPQTVELIEAVLDQRQREVAAGEGSTSLHPDASDDVRQRWARATAGFAGVGMSVYEEELQRPVLDLTPPGLVGPDGEPVVVVEVTRHWAVEGVDPHPAADTLLLAVSTTSGTATVVHDDPLRRLGVTSSRTLWEVAEVTVERDGGVVLVGEPSRAARMREVAGLLRRAHDTISAIDPPAAYLVLVPTGADQAKEFLQTPLDVSKFVAFVSFSVDRSESWQAGPPRLVLQEGNLRRRSTTRQVAILAHELVHVDALADSGPLTPLWVHEGYADWEANSRTATARGQLEIPEAHQFRSGSVGDIVAAYDASEALFARVADLLGNDAPRRLFDEVGSARSVPGTLTHRVDEALARLGLDRATLGGTS